MTVREILDENEKKYFSRHATLSSMSKGREKPEKPCSVRTEFQRDRDRIIHCKSFRRLKYKTQVFFCPEGDHYRDRLTHTLEVAQISRTIAKALFLNEDLTEAIALGHDLGHTPFGHAGEKVLDQILKEKLGHSFYFMHNEQSIRVVKKIEKNGEGLNLSYEVLDGIENHTGDKIPKTLEGRIVRISDKIAYINHDIDDALRSEIFSLNDLPQNNLAVLGFSHRERINNIVIDIIKKSMDKDDILMSDNVEESLFSLRDFLFENLYLRSPIKIEERKTEKVISDLFNFYLSDFDFFIKDSCFKKNKYYLNLKNASSIDNETKSFLITDYIASMTDRYALNKYSELFIPEKWEIVR